MIKIIKILKKIEFKYIYVVHYINMLSPQLKRKRDSEYSIEPTKESNVIIKKSIKKHKINTQIKYKECKIYPHTHPSMFANLTDNEIYTIPINNIIQIYKNTPNILLNIKKRRRQLKNVYSARKSKLQKDKIYNQTIQKNNNIIENNKKLKMEIKMMKNEITKNEKTIQKIVDETNKLNKKNIMLNKTIKSFQKSLSEISLLKQSLYTNDNYDEHLLFENEEFPFGQYYRTN